MANSANEAVAVKYYERKLREKAWLAWTAASDSILEEQIKTETALEFWGRKQLKPMFLLWKSRAGTTVKCKLAMTTVFINCVATGRPRAPRMIGDHGLSALNSERHRRLVMMATSYHRRNLLAWVWTGVRIFCRDVSVIRAKMIIAAQFFEDNFFATLTREVRRAIAAHVATSV